MNHLHELRSVLMELKTKERESVDADAHALIDKALELVDACLNDRARVSPAEVLEFVGKIIEKIPAVVAAFECLKRLT